MDGSLKDRRAARPLVIRPSRAWTPVNIREMIEFRDVAVRLARRDITLRYRQTFLGALWVVLQPLLAAGVFSFVFGKVAKLSTDGVPYFLFSYAGMLCWGAFSTTLSKASTSLVSNASLVSKVFFPRALLPGSVVLSTVLDFAVSMVVMVTLLFAYHVEPGPTILLLPVWLTLTLLLATGAGFVSSALMVRYRDINYILPVVLQMLLYISPIAYAVTAVPAQYQSFYALNPLTGLLEAFRWSLLGRGSLPVGAVAVSAVIACATFWIGLVVFHQWERGFADVI